MSISALSSSPVSETFGKDASFKLEQPIGSMSISPSGRDVVLASKEGLHIIDLDSPYSPPRFLPHRTPWEVADVQWSPFATRDYWVVSTSNQKALVWNLAAQGWRNSIEFVLHGHTRAITDINFSAFHADILATCAVDSFVHCWDLRTPSKPAFSFSDWFAAATQVKWSRQDEHLVASSHDKVLHIWDDRKGAYPLRTIQAHDTKIYGIDWNRFEPSKLVTCSLDKTIKFWDTNNDDDVPDRIIQTTFPVWRARHTPFGWGLTVMPQRGNGDLHLYDRRPVNGVLESGPVRPAHTFAGHKGQVKEFLWRAWGTVKDGVDQRDFQLVSWGTDGELKLHHVSAETFADVGYEKGVTKTQRLHFTRKGARYRTFRDEVREPSSPLDFPLRTDSSSTHAQFLSVKGRTSTNVGMNKIPILQFRGWLQSGRRDRRTGMHGKGNLRKDLDPISWMKNVKIASWNTDTLADELTQVGEKFKRIEFEALDVSQRKATMSLQGPWGEKGSSVYTRVDFRFPKSYPRDSRAAVNLQSQSSINPETHKKLSSEIQKITEVFADQGRGCIEAIVRYLLHEQTLDQITDWVLGDSLTESKLLGADVGGDASSDSDDDDQINAVANASNSSANIRVPLAKGCAALWSDSGKLVCFFVPKPKETTSFLSGLGTSRFDESESSRFFGGFGELHTDSPSRKTRNDAKESIDDSPSESSDSSSMFSSSSSSSSSDGINMHDRFDTFRTTALGTRQRTKSPDGSNRSTTQEGTKMGELTRMNIVSIRHDLEDLVPAKRYLAEAYQILGHGARVCKHNATVSERALLSNIASVWTLSALILEDNVPLSVQKMPRKSRDDILVLARRAVLSLNAKESDKTSTVNTSANHMSNRLAGRTKWGKNPLGPTCLLPSIFHFFEVEADIQMLAMISIIFMQAEVELSSAPRQSSKPPLSFRPSTAQYFVSPEMAKSLTKVKPGRMKLFQSSSTVRPSTASIAHSRSQDHDNSLHLRRRSLGSASIAPHMISISTGDSRDSSHAPSVIAEDPSGIIAPIHSTVASLSTSPDDSRFTHRSDSSSAFPISRATLNALAKSYSNSPTSRTTGGYTSAADSSSRSTKGMYDRDSAIDDSRSKIRTSVTMTHLPSARNEHLDISRGSIRSILKTRTEAKRRNAGNKGQRKMKTRLHNQDQFDLDNQPATPLIPEHMRDKCISYVKQYLSLLEVWQLWQQRSEMLQACAQYEKMEMQMRQLNCTAAAPPNKQLEVRRCCPSCGNTLAPIEKNGRPIGWHCIDSRCEASSRKLSRRQACSVCEVIVKGLAVPCLQCGHLTCYECAEGWFMPQGVHQRTSSINSTTPSVDLDAFVSDDSKSSEQHRTCPTGCGCSCPTLETIDVPQPPEREEAQPVASTPLSRSESHHSSQGGTSSPKQVRSHRLMSSNGPDTAISALLSIGNRSRSVSTAKTSVATATTNASGESDSLPHSATDELVPWATLHQGRTLGRGVGAGLSRGLNTKGSSSTIRKAPT